MSLVLERNQVLDIYAQAAENKWVASAVSLFLRKRATIEVPDINKLFSEDTSCSFTQP